MTWNHRVMKKGRGKNAVFQIHEVFYDKGKVKLHTVEPMTPQGLTLEELKAEIRLMLRSCYEPVLAWRKK